MTSRKKKKKKRQKETFCSKFPVLKKNISLFKIQRRLQSHPSHFAETKHFQQHFLSSFLTKNPPKKPYWNQSPISYVFPSYLQRCLNGSGARGGILKHTRCRHVYPPVEVTDLDGTFVALTAPPPSAIVKLRNNGSFQYPCLLVTQDDVQARKGLRNVRVSLSFVDRSCSFDVGAL